MVETLRRERLLDRLEFEDLRKPARRLQGVLGRLPWPWPFTVIVFVPTLLAALYYLLIASPQYVSEAQFVVRTHTPLPQVGFGTVLQSVGVDLGSAASTDAYEVHQYMMSRDAVAELDRNHKLRAALGRPGADFMARFPRPFEQPKFENLYKDYKRFVTVGYDATTGISSLKVTTFDSRDSQTIANALLDGSEALVNRLNERAAHDTIEEAQKQVMEAEVRTLQAQKALTSFRSRERIIDPARSSLVTSELVGKLDAQIAGLRAERASLAASAPQSPDLPAMDRRIQAYEAQRQSEQSRVAGESDSLAPKIGEYENLMLERDFAEKTLASANAALEGARIEARRKQLYLERIVTPNLPDKAEMPHRLQSLGLVLMSCLLIYAIVMLIAAGFREHQQA